MPLPYEVTLNITREDARAVIKRLIKDEEYRAAFEANPREMLEEVGIVVGDETLPEQVVLPDRAAMRLFLDLLETRGLASESASPFGFALMILAFGAMPVQLGADSAGDGAG
jgi:hypothetical protein